MLQIEKPRSGLALGDSSPQVGSTAEQFTEFVALIRRQYPVVLFVLSLIVALGALYIFTAPPRFTGTADLIIDTRRVQLFQQQQPSASSDLPPDTGMVDSQVEILKSENIALSVIKDLRLTEDPEFVSPDGGLIGNVIGLVVGIFESSKNEPRSEFELTRATLERFKKLLSIKRVGLTYVLEIEFQSTDPNRASQIANAVADAYIVDSLEAKYQTTRRAAVWLQDRLKELQQQASVAERAAVDFKGKNGIVDTGGRLLNEQQLAELNSALIQARAQTAEAQARMNRVNDILRAASAAGLETATVTDALHSDVITRLRQQYLDLAARESDWSKRYGQNHLAAVNLRNQMDEIRRSILDELHRIAETYKSDYEIAKSREDSVQKSLAEIVSQSQTTNEAQITLHELESNSQSYRALYDNFLQRYMESIQQQSFPYTEARLITQATRPLRPSHPRTLLVLAVAVFGGLILGLGTGLLRDVFDRVFRTRSQVEANLGTDCLAMVPIVKARPPRKSRLRTDLAATASRIIARQASPLWAATDAPFSRYAEAMRSVKVAIDLNGANKTNKVIGITSSMPNEGKSTIAMSLGQVISQGGARVIVVDCDLRNPALTRELAPGAKLGILDVISGKAALEDVIWTDSSTNVTFLPAMSDVRLAHTAEILGASGMKKLFDRLRDLYDIVIVDLSPLAPVVDVRATSNIVDSYLFVIEWGTVRIDVVEHVLREARGVYDNLLGVVLNKVNFRGLGRYEAHSGNYYHKRYYARYGYAE
jgi:succinoglycan biosynthesis transport protein ExoP